MRGVEGENDGDNVINIQHESIGIVTMNPPQNEYINEIAMVFT
jgi:hypothetical protein